MTTPTPPTWRRFLPSFLQFRLSILLMALALGITGMKYNNDHVIWAAIAFGVIGVGLRFFGKHFGGHRSP